MFEPYTLFILLMICKLSAGFEYFLSNVSGEVSKGNFVYYSMSYDGTILLELTSVSGDCDLYVSQNTNKPSYEPESNCLSSSTCGIDSVIIPKSCLHTFEHQQTEFLILLKQLSQICQSSQILYVKELYQLKGVTISFKRPVGIGIFGHPSHELCSYNLIFYRIDDSRDIFHFDPYTETLQSDVNKQLHQRSSTGSSTSESEEESLVWIFLRSVVVFLIEIIL